VSSNERGKRSGNGSVVVNVSEDIYHLIFVRQFDMTCYNKCN